MAYVAVSGGKEAIEASIKLLDYYRSGTDKDVEVEAIMGKLSLLVDRVMSEAGLYSKAYAALALKLLCADEMLKVIVTDADCVYHEPQESVAARNYERASSAEGVSTATQEPPALAECNERLKRATARCGAK